MALIKCPECGRENVSDSAESCPDCGYGIKTHFEKIKMQEEEKIRRKRQKEEDEQRTQKRYEELTKNLDQELQAIDNMPYPDKPSYFKMLFDGKGAGGFTYTAIIVLVVSLLLAPSSGFFIFIFAITLVLGVPALLFITYIDYKMFIDMYREQTNDWEKYKEQQKENLIERYKSQAVTDTDRALQAVLYKMEQKRKVEAEVKIPKCPMCGSTNIEKISTTSRAVSVATVGLASGKIGKQYKCKKCKHMW